ncbi:MAG: FtsX-like permease family protein [Deltaproteobacteria bacterium]|nr:FtsX-like permease family protein [Deltaproteobacteria bacterium]
MQGFSKLLKICWRNIFRNQRRCLLTLSILVLGCTGLILIGGFFDNMMEGFGEVFIHSQTGHIQINAKGYNRKGARAPLDYLLPDSMTILQTVEKNPNVSMVAPRLKFQGMASSNETAIAVMALGVDPTIENKMGSFQTTGENLPSTNIVEGKDLEENDPYGVIVGKGLMDAMGLRVGDTFSFITTRKEGALDGSEFKIKGVFETFIKDFDDRSLKMNLKTSQKILGLTNEVHSLLVVLDKTSKTDSAKSELLAALGPAANNLEMLTWVEQGQYYRQSKQLLQQIYAIIQIIISIIFFFSIANTINMILLERMREFGTMMAVGNSRATLFGMIFLETALLGLLGSLMGLLVGTGLAKIVSMIGIPIQPPQAAGFYYCMINVTPGLLLQTFAISMVSSLLSSLLPAYRVSHFPIIHALGYV